LVTVIRITLLNPLSQMKYLLSLLAMLFAVHFSYAQNTFPTPSGKVGIGTITPDVNLHIFEILDSRPGGVSAPTKSIFKLSRAGTGGSSYNESAEFRIGHGGSNVWGSQLDLYVNGGSNQSNIPDQHAMSWLYNGHIGIGTSNPGAVLSIVNSTPVIQLFDQEVNPGDGSGLGKIAFGSVNEFASLEAIRLSGSADDVTALKFSTSWATGAGGDGNNLERMRINFNGNVGIGTQSPDQKLTVNGTIHSKEVKVDTSIPVPDYVFDADYKLTSLTEVKDYIAKNHHLPEIPSAAQIEKDGLKLGEMNILLLKKVEELTLHLIEKDQETKELKQSKDIQQTQLDQLKQQLESLTQVIHKN
jgi:hypothetical protein